VIRGPAAAGLVLLSVTGASALAVPEVSGDDGSFAVDYAFSLQLGSGIYSVNGRTVQIYDAGVLVNLRRPAADRIGFKLRFVGGVGLYDFKLKDGVSGFPDHLSTVSFLPTLLAEIPLRPGWWLVPYGGTGLGKDLSNGDTNIIYALGVQSVLSLTRGAWGLRIGNRLVYTGYTTERVGLINDFSLLESGADLGRLVGVRLGRRRLAISVFGVSDLYFLSPQVVRQIPQQADIRTGWEAGITVGVEPAWRLLGIRLPRTGVGYRFGRGPGAVRVFLGDPFPVHFPSVGDGGRGTWEDGKGGEEES
jgi:hypothetical protein